MPDQSAKRIARKLIYYTIKDLSSSNIDIVAAAEMFLEHESLGEVVKAADYPKELRDTMSELVLLSPTERRVESKEILALLKEHWG
jgi:hypothetical protein